MIDMILISDDIHSPVSNWFALLILFCDWINKTTNTDEAGVSDTILAKSSSNRNLETWTWYARNWVVVARWFWHILSPFQ